MNLDWALLGLALTPIAMQSAIAVSMLARKIYRAFPCFFAYVCFVVLSASALFAMNPTAHKYFPSYVAFFYAYWAQEAVSIFLGIMVIAELFKKTLDSYEGLRHLGTVLFRWAALVMVLVAMAAATALPNGEPTGIIGTIIAVDRALRVVQVGLLAFLFLFSSYFGLRLLDLTFGIALGFGLLAGVEIAVTAVRSHFGPTANSVLLLQPIAYNCAVFVWGAYVLRRERSPRASHLPAAHDLRRWNEALLELWHQ